MTYRRRLVFPALMAAGILWGTTVPLSKLALAWLTPGWLAVARFAVAAALLALVSRSRLRGAASPAILLTGAAGYGGSVLLQNFGIERTSVMHAALLIGATPVLVAVLAAALGHGVAKPVAWAGFVLSLLGVGFVAAGKGGGASLCGDGLVLASQFASAGFTVSQARLLRGRDPVAVTALQLAAAAFAVLPAAAVAGRVTSAAASPTTVAATAALVLAGTVAPTTLFAFAQSRVKADVAGAFLNLEPLFGAVIGVLLFGNPMGAAQVVGGGAIVSGIALSSYQVVRQERGRLPRAAPSARPAAASGPAPGRVAVRTAGRVAVQAAGPVAVRAAGRVAVQAAGRVTVQAAEGATDRAGGPAGLVATTVVRAGAVVTPDPVRSRRSEQGAQPVSSRGGRVRYVPWARRRQAAARRAAMTGQTRRRGRLRPTSRPASASAARRARISRLPVAGPGGDEEPGKTWAWPGRLVGC